MACFLVSAAEAVVVTVVTAAQSKKEKEMELEMKDGAVTESVIAEDQSMASVHVPFVKKLKWLSYMLWGGAILLAFEHIWHGEVAPWFPFLTAMADPADMMEMFHEMATVGVTMAVLITCVWALMVVVSNVIEKRQLPEETKQEA